MRTCSVEGCERKHSSKGYCGKHYVQIKRCGEIIDDKIKYKLEHPRLCSVEGCNNKHRRNDFCERHAQQYKKYGRILERTKYDPNKIIIHKDYAEIEIYNRQCEPIAYAKIDLDDVEKVKDYKWGMDSYGYIVGSGNNCNIMLQSYIMNFKGNNKILVDHKNRDKLDNRKQNLRIVTARLNAWNRTKQKNNTSGVTGVHFEKRIINNKQYICWLAIIANKVIGRFKTKEEAILCRKEAKERYTDELNKEVISNEDLIISAC